MYLQQLLGGILRLSALKLGWNALAFAIALPDSGIEATLWFKACLWLSLALALLVWQNAAKLARLLLAPAASPLQSAFMAGLSAVMCWQITAGIPEALKILLEYSNDLPMKLHKLFLPACAIIMLSMRQILAKRIFAGD